MKKFDILRIAIGNLRRNRLRTLLTVSGVVVGIGAIVFLVSLGFGLQQLATEKIIKLDALKVITVTSGGKNDATIETNTLEKFKKIENVEIVSPVTRGLISFKYKSETEQILYGFNTEYFDIENIKIIAGNGFSSGSAKEILLSKDAVTNIGAENEDLVNKELDFVIKGIGIEKAIRLKVAGIIAEKGVYAPISLMENSQNSGAYASAKIKVNDKNNVPLVKRIIESMGYNTQVVQDQSKSVSQIFYIVNIVLAGFGMIALFVAAIGIFNTMTISLLERTHEIGVMKAIGGEDGAIALIFVTESAMIGLLGGIFGLLGGAGVGWIINMLVNFLALESGGETNSLFMTPTYFSIITVVFSFLISTIAGIWPARRAARLNPLEALRYE